MAETPRQQHRNQRGPRTERRLLGQRLAQEALVPLLLGRPPHGRHVLFTISPCRRCAWNDSHWKNARFNELLPQARAELDDAKRAAMYAEMRSSCMTTAARWFCMFTNYVGAM
jgi:ABC-type transport system substrate-binding protein